jgi:hypothetical protein
VWSNILIVNWVATFVAAASIQPTVSIFFWVVSEFNESAHLGHNLVSVAHVGGGDVYTVAACGISFLGILLPNIKVNTVGRIVWLPLGTTVLSFLASW